MPSVHPPSQTYNYMLPIRMGVWCTFIHLEYWGTTVWFTSLSTGWLLLPLSTGYDLPVCEQNLTGVWFASLSTGQLLSGVLTHQSWVLLSPLPVLSSRWGVIYHSWVLGWLLPTMNAGWIYQSRILGWLFPVLSTGVAFYQSEYWVIVQAEYTLW